MTWRKSTFGLLIWERGFFSRLPCKSAATCSPFGITREFIVTCPGLSPFCCLFELEFSVYFQQSTLLLVWVLQNHFWRSIGSLVCRLHPSLWVVSSLFLQINHSCWDILFSSASKQVVYCWEILSFSYNFRCNLSQLRPCLRTSIASIRRSDIRRSLRSRPVNHPKIQ